MSGRLDVVSRISTSLKSFLGEDAHSRLRRRLLRPYSLIPRIFWSQTGEDVVLASLLPERDGVYVDVGAAHPRLASNTYFLYRRGWRGTLIEPNPTSAQELRKLRRGDRVVEAAAGNGSGFVTLTIFRSDFLSTVDPAVSDERSRAGKDVDEYVKVPVVRLSTLGLEASPTEPSLLSIDCEGLDLEVLEGNDWDAFRPRVICVEESFTTLTRPSPIRRFLEERGYLLYAHTSVSAIYYFDPAQDVAQ